MKNVEYVGTKAENTTFVYNNIENVSKKAVELKNIQTSTSSSQGIGVGASLNLSPDLNKNANVPKGQDSHTANSTGVIVNISANKSKQNTNETIYQNGSFVNVNEIYNNTKNMTLEGFNQEDGKVIGNIENLVIKSKQNTSETDGYSVGGSVGIPVGLGAVSVNENGSQTDGNRAFVDSQSSFSVGENSNLKIKNVTNEAGIIGTNGQNSNIKIEKYVGKNIENSENLTTTGVSGGTDGVGVNYSNSEKEGITRNTVIGNVEIEKSSGDSINIDLNKANEIRKDSNFITNIYAEDSLIKAVQRPDEFKGKLKLASQELKDMAEVIRDSVKNQGVDKRNFVELLNSKRRGTTMSNLVARDLEHLEATKSTKTTEQYQEELKMIVENFGKDIGIEMNLIYTDEARMPKDSKGKGGAARRESDGKLVAYVDVTKNKTTSELLGTVFEEVAHLIDLQAGRKRETTEEEKQRGEHGLETLGRPIGNYFKDKYEETSTDFTNAQIDTEDYTDVDGETVGNSNFCVGNSCKSVQKERERNIDLFTSSIKYPKTPEEREKALKKIGFGSIYVGIYLSDDEIANVLLVNDSEKDPSKKNYRTLYMDKKLPNEYNRVMSLPSTKKGFNENLIKIGNKLVDELKKEKIKDNKIVSFKDKFKKEISTKVNLTYKGGFSWGSTNVRTKVENIKVTRNKDGYEINIKYGNRLYDYFDSAIDIFNFSKKNIDLPNAQLYIMKSSYIKKEIKFNVKNVNEIPIKIREVIKNDK